MKKVIAFVSFILLSGVSQTRAEIGFAMGKKAPLTITIENKTNDIATVTATYKNKTEVIGSVDTDKKVSFDTISTHNLEKITVVAGHTTQEIRDFSAPQTIILKKSTKNR